MSTINKIRIGFLFFWLFYLGVDVAQGNEVFAIIALIFIGYNSYGLYRAYEEGTL